MCNCKYKITKLWKNKAILVSNPTGMASTVNELDEVSGKGFNTVYKYFQRNKRGHRLTPE